VEQREQLRQTSRTRQRPFEVVDRPSECVLKRSDEARVRDNREDLLEPRVTAQQGVEDSEKNGGKDGRDQGDADHLTNRRRVLAALDASFHAIKRLRGQLEAD